MKRYFLLVSVLALAACGGGSGGGSAPAGTPVRTAIVAGSSVAQSNAAVTSMASELLVANGTAITPSRSATASYNGKTYTSYRLDDVTFRMAGEDSQIIFGLDDEGRIISAGKYDYDEDSGKYLLSKEGTFARASTSGADFGSAKTLYAWEKTVSDTGLEAAITTAINGGDLPGTTTAGDIAGWISDQVGDTLVVQSDNANADAKALLEARVDNRVKKWADSQDSSLKSKAWFDAVVTAAKAFYKAQIPSDFNDAPGEYTTKLSIKGADIGLKYADLGFAGLIVAPKDDPNNPVESTFTPYVGGYDAIERNVGTATEFTGTALAGVEHKASNGEKDSVLVRHNNAKLTLNTDGSSSLVMANDGLIHVQDDGVTPHTDGAHWYNLTVTKNAAAVGEHNGATFTIGGSNTITGYNLPAVPAQPVSFAANTYDASEGHYAKTENTGIHYGGSVENQAYGTSDSDIEATSQFSFSVENTATHEEVAIYGAFGGKPTPAE